MHLLKQAVVHPLVCSLALSLAGLAVVENTMADVYAARGGGASDDVNMISRFGDQQSGNATPVGLLGGAATGLQGSSGIFFDATDRLFYVSDHNGYSVRVFSEFAAGNTAPLRVISYSIGALPTGVQVIAKYNELTISSNVGVVTVSRYANGNVAPTRQIQTNPLSKLDYPQGLVYSARSDELFVGDHAEPSPGTRMGEILVFPRTANNVDAPARTISGNLTGLGTGVLDLAINAAAGELYVLSEETLPDDSFGWVLQSFSLNANGNVAPIRSIRGTNTQLQWATSLAYDSSNDQLVVANNAGFVTYPSLLFFRRTANGNVAPVKVISGSNTGLASAGDGWWAVATVDHNLIFKDGFE